MNSLVRLPTAIESNLNYPVKIVIANSTFQRLSFCGSIISNGEITNSVLDLVAMRSVGIFLDKHIYSYHVFLDMGRSQYINRKFKQSSVTYQNPEQSVIEFIGNTVSDLNFLKDGRTDYPENFRSGTSHVSNTPRRDLQNWGLVIDLNEDFGRANITI